MRNDDYGIMALFIAGNVRMAIHNMCVDAHEKMRYIMAGKGRMAIHTMCVGAHGILC